MFGSFARFLVRRRVVVLIAAVVAFALSGIFGRGVERNLTSGGFADPGTDSIRAAEVLDREFTGGSRNLVLLVTAEEGVDRPAAVRAGMALTEELASEEGIASVESYWSLRVPALASTDGTQALVLGEILGDEDEVIERLEQLTATYTRSDDVLDVSVGGFAEAFRQVSETVRADLTRAELIAFPIVLILLLLIFRSVVAALLPLAVGAVAVVGTIAILQLLAGVTDVAVYALNLTTALGLGLAIDYSLFIVSRFREELARGLAVDDAVVRTLETAGKTVVFSGGTVAISLAALLVFPQVFMRSFAYSGIAVTGIAVGGATAALPALLAVLGRRVDSLRILRRRPVAEGEGRWHRIAVAVMRRPIPIATMVTAFLVLVGAPFLHVNFGSVDDRVLPAENPARRVAEEQRDNFAGNESAPVTIVAAGIGNPRVRKTEIHEYAIALSTVEGVERVDALTGSYIDGARVIPANPTSVHYASSGSTWLSAVPAVEPISAEAKRMVADLRAVEPPFNGVLVGGLSAEVFDSQESLLRRLPVAIGAIAAITFGVLFLMVGSLFVPVKALVMNTLSLTTMFGAMVWIFQEGHLSRLLGFTATGALDLNIPILMFCLAFGLSMDYEVFLLSRIREEYDRTGDNATAVAMGLEKTGGIVTAAAALIAVVFIAFATSRITIIKLFGIGLALAVIVDATLVRALLVPATMKLAGEVNWWLPRPLRRIYQRYGIHEDGRARGEAEVLPMPSGEPQPPGTVRPERRTREEEPELERRYP